MLLSVTRHHLAPCRQPWQPAPSSGYSVQPRPPPPADNTALQQHCPRRLTKNCCAAAPQERRIRDRVEALEADTGVKLRVLAQNYPQVGAGQLEAYSCTQLLYLTSDEGRCWHKTARRWVLGSWKLIPVRNCCTR